MYSERDSEREVDPNQIEMQVQNAGSNYPHLDRPSNANVGSAHKFQESSRPNVQQQRIAGGMRPVNQGAKHPVAEDKL